MCRESIREAARQFVLATVCGAALSYSITTAAQDGDSRRWQYEFDEADIEEVIRYTQEATGKTFLVDPRVKGEVTLHSSQPVTAQTLYARFLSVLKVNGFTAVEKNNIVYIIPQEEARTAPTPTR